MQAKLNERCHKIAMMVVAETNQATWWEEGNSDQREVARNLWEGNGDPNQRGRQCGWRRAMAMKGKATWHTRMVKPTTALLPHAWPNTEGG